MKGIVFDIQHYAMYDGPGIRTCVFLKGCPLHCVWCHNPESWFRQPEISYFAEKCAACGQCVDACPNQALHLHGDHVVRDPARCKVCGACVQACPNQAMDRIGEEMDVAEVVAKVLPDRPFYENSGGGITVSGGEPTMQADFLPALLRALKPHGLHVALETCGAFGEELLAELLPLVDLFLYDLKLIDAEAHQRFTGVDNQTILAHFVKIIEQAGSERIVPRIPVIPSVNTFPHTIDDFIFFLQRAGYAGEVHLMPYNRLSKNKWEKIGKGGAYADMGELTEDTLSRIVAKFAKAGFEVVINQ